MLPAAAFSIRHPSTLTAQRSSTGPPESGQGPGTPSASASSTPVAVTGRPRTPATLTKGTSQALLPSAALDTELAKRGSNFGLPIALQLVRAMGGAIGIESVGGSQSELEGPLAVEVCQVAVVLCAVRVRFWLLLP
jgi:hypothetical protein